MPNFEVRGRHAIVTGSGSGLGRTFALTLASGGALVSCAEVNAATGEETAALIRQAGGAGVFHPMDVADETSVRGAVVAAQLMHGPCAILVNNAGIAVRPARGHETPVAEWDRLMGINLRGSFLLAQAVLPSMLAERRGSIINIASIIGNVGVYPGFPVTGVAYAASKAAIGGLTRQLAVEYAADGIRVNAIAPGWHSGTNLGYWSESSQDVVDRLVRYIGESVPMGRRGDMQELAGLLLYLASDASSYVTGQVFSHDGGVTAA
jgi:NAD(P)-dependent dehydrogenase (short-subunit alcohol dehydrogenase family)